RYNLSYGSIFLYYFFFSSRRRHTRFKCDWSSDVCSSDLPGKFEGKAGVFERKRLANFARGEIEPANKTAVISQGFRIAAIVRIPFPAPPTGNARTAIHIIDRVFLAWNKRDIARNGSVGERQI